MSRLVRAAVLFLSLTAMSSGWLVLQRRHSDSEGSADRAQMVNNVENCEGLAEIAVYVGGNVGEHSSFINLSTDRCNSRW